MKNYLKKSVLLTAVFTALFSLNTHAQQTAEIESIIEQKRSFNKQLTKVDGYKIQLYNGNESSAYRTKENFITKFPYSVKIEYKAPDWKVHVGNFRTRIEADRALNRIKAEFGSAFILKTKIYI